jgi:uncharacterized protein
MLTEKLEAAAERTAEEKAAPKTKKATAKKEEGFFDNPAVKQAGRTAASVITRSLLGALGLGGRTRRKTTNWF